MRAVLNWQTLLAAFFILLPTVLGFYHGVRGRVVIASPEMDDPNFSRTVLYMFEHDWYRARAVVLNRPYTDLTVLPSHIVNLGVPLYWGGPVEDRESVHVVDLCQDGRRPVVGELDHLISLNSDFVRDLRDRQECYRVYVGYAGWGMAQFELEKERGGWQTALYQPFVFENSLLPDLLWEALMPYTDDKEKKEIGRRQKT